MSKNKYYPREETPAPVTKEVEAEEITVEAPVTTEEVRVEATEASTEAPVEEPSVDITPPSVKAEEMPPVKAKPKQESGKKGPIDMNTDFLLNEYHDKMAPGKPIDPKKGGAHQFGLWQLIKNMLALEDQSAFNLAFNTVLMFANAHKEKLFSESYIYRFPEHWPGSEGEFTNFRRIIYLIINTANPATRNKQLQEINIEKTIEGFSEKEKNKLIVFFNL